MRSTFNILFYVNKSKEKNGMVPVMGRVTIWKPNSLTNPPNFASPRIVCFLILPRFAFILGRIALIFPNRFAFTSFFSNFARNFAI